jgi:DNA-binding NtrC family response regulator
MGNSLRVLIVDDDPNMTRTLEDILAASGFTAETATDAHEGLVRFEQNFYQVVLTDIRMPGMNGVEFQRAIKVKYPEVSILLMTAYAEYELIAQGRLEGALAFLEKPLNIPLLLSILRAIEKDTFRKSSE